MTLTLNEVEGSSYKPASPSNFRWQVISLSGAAARRQRRISVAPEPLRPAVSGFAASMLHARERARRAGTRPRADHTIEVALAITRDLAVFLDRQRGKLDWAPTSMDDIEAFLGTQPRHRNALSC